MKLKYKEGTIFLVPLRSGGFSRGVVARFDGKGTVLGYFFGPVTNKPDGVLPLLDPADACLVGRFGDVGLLKGSWPITGSLLEWKRENWPVPPFYRHDEKTEKAWLSFYSDQNLSFLREEPTEFSHESALPYDRLMGYGAVEIRLTASLNSAPNSKILA